MTFFHHQNGSAYYSEFDEEKAYWLCELMRENVIAPGTIDTRSIEDVAPTELTGFVQHHFFAGIGVWSYAARLAGWPDDQPLRTLSCPCQPFSAAGLGGAFTDERHLWPAAAWHIEFGQPCPTFGEQVASRDGLAWLDVVSSDVEAKGYAIAPLDLCSAGVGSPNIRQRLYFVADPASEEPLPGSLRGIHRGEEGGRPRHAESERLGSDGGLEDSDGGRLGTRRGGESEATQHEGRDGFPEQRGSDDGMARTGVVQDDAGSSRLEGQSGNGDSGQGRAATTRSASETSVPHGVADTHANGCTTKPVAGFHDAEHHLESCYRAGQLADASRTGRRQRSADTGRRRSGSGAQGLEQRTIRSGVCDSGLADSGLPERSRRDSDAEGFLRTPRSESSSHGALGRTGPTNGFWRLADWLFCRDERWRPVEPGTFPLASGITGRMGLLRGYGDAINAELAAAFIRAYRQERGLDTTPFPFPWLGVDA